MNKILKGSIVLIVFTFAISIFQMSCKDNVIAQAASYILPVASPSLLGGVKPDGATILVDATGKISTVGTGALPIASTSTLGGVKPDGTTILVDATGKISTVGAATLPIATTTTLGGVKPDGTTVTIDGTGKLSSFGLQQSNKILFVLGGGSSINLDMPELWYINYDGTNKVQVPLSGLPPVSSPNHEMHYTDFKFSPDGQTIFIGGHDSFGNISFIYSMSTSGTNVKKILEYAGNNGVLSSIQAY